MAKNAIGSSGVGIDTGVGAAISGGVSNMLGGGIAGMVGGGISSITGISKKIDNTLSDIGSGAKDIFDKIF
jgi:hypothetical protein